jgi:single-strand DNA-binding protein
MPGSATAILADVRGSSSRVGAEEDRMSDVTVTVFGYVGTEVEFRGGNGKAERAMFRIGSTPRYYDRAAREWRDSETVWLTVKAWRDLARNVASSINKGEPVVVVGKLRTSVWTSDDGVEHRRDVLEATTVAHDLARGTSAFHRAERVVEREDTSSEDEDMFRELDRSSSEPDGFGTTANPEPAVATLGVA